MAQSAANLVDHVWFVNHSSASLPDVPLRQFVVTFPFELRARLAYDGKLLSAVTRIAIDSALGFYKRRIRDEQDIKGQSGAVSVVQRVSSDLRLNPHLHAIVVDGVFSVNSDSVVFHPLARLDDSDREALARYVMRPPLAQERLHLLPDNLVRIELKRAFRDGDAEEWLKNHTCAIDLDP
jgi:hypothetical protein